MTTENYPGGGVPNGTTPCLALAYAVAALQRDHEKWGQSNGISSSASGLFLPNPFLSNAAFLAAHHPTYMVVPGSMIRTNTTTTTPFANETSMIGVASNNGDVHKTLSQESQQPQHQAKVQQQGQNYCKERKTKLVLDEHEEDNHDEHEDGDDLDGEDGADDGQRLVRSRERNREHARRTRLRKKAHMEALHVKIRRLESERQQLRLKIEECSIASILLGLSNGTDENKGIETTTSSSKEAALVENNHTADSARIALLTAGGGKRKRFQIESVTVPIAQRTQKVGSPTSSVLSVGKSHINWKTGVYVDDRGNQKHLSQEQLETMRRERNRMHAKMTRDRRKCFIARMESAVADLERDIHHMKSILDQTQSESPVLSTKIKSEEFEKLGQVDDETQDMTDVGQGTAGVTDDDDEHDSSGDSSNETFTLTAAV